MRRGTARNESYCGAYSLHVLLWRKPRGKGVVLTDEYEAILQGQLEHAWHVVDGLKEGWKQAHHWEAMYLTLRAIMAASTPQGFDDQWFDRRMAEIIAEAGNG